MTSTEFNTKYKDFLEKGSYGLAIENEQVIKFLDEIFVVLILFPEFEYHQIKVKFGQPRFYSSLGQNVLSTLIEEKIRSLLND